MERRTAGGEKSSQRCGERSERQRRETELLLRLTLSYLFSCSSFSALERASCARFCLTACSMSIAPACPNALAFRLVGRSGRTAVNGGERRWKAAIDAPSSLWLGGLHRPVLLGLLLLVHLVQRHALVVPVVAVPLLQHPKGEGTALAERAATKHKRKAGVCLFPTCSSDALPQCTAAPAQSSDEAHLAASWWHCARSNTQPQDTISAATVAVVIGVSDHTCPASSSSVCLGGPAGTWRPLARPSMSDRCRSTCDRCLSSRFCICGQSLPSRKGERDVDWQYRQWRSGPAPPRPAAACRPAGPEG